MRVTAGAHPRREELPMASAIPDPAARDLLRRAACLPYGLSLVEFGWLPCAAAVLGVEIGDVTAVRTALADPGARPALVGEYTHAVGLRDADPDAFCRTCTAEGRPPTPGCPVALIREAAARPSGLETLRSADVEVAATAFRVHPFVILGARDWLARREAPGA
jgi:hypothetical protein